MSTLADPEAAPSAAVKQTAPAPVAANPVASLSVSAAPGIRNSTSRSGGTGRLRPSRLSRPTAVPYGQLGQPVGPLLQRGVDSSADRLAVRPRRATCTGASSPATTPRNDATGHDRDIPVRDVRQLVRQHALEFLDVEPAQHPGRHAQPVDHAVQQRFLLRCHDHCPHGHERDPGRRTRTAPRARHQQ